MSSIAKEFGQLLRQKRKELGVSQDKLALMSDIDRSYVGRVERGEVNITLEKVYQFAKALNCDVRQLIP
ncbi:helix-turn-helix domain-containing protein [Pleionea litopenaei]|uniref:Helix-turn-helix transcriptional regulator n=1 Tax=Pleionea litopenaei TaxID=3070815 RepID=A0AA51RS82_9GAMM|nr:helix-turn-helix transcriptional regulator [Pleionea sp. HL-JVS1]WMS86703.1 helix-turn-helix transcriptional regulator [Pleionea sp. HL-JVS1]